MHVNLKYLGEAIFLIGIAFRLLRWAWSAVQEGDAPPSASPDVTASVGGALPPKGVGQQVATLLDSGPGAVGGLAPSWGTHDPATASNADLFPPAMLAAMTPEQRAAVLETLVKEQVSRNPSRPAA